jgi:hypothetical protein
MPELQRVGSLEIEDDRHFRRRDWAFQRAGMFLMAVLLALVLAGLTGSGPLARGTAAGGQLTVHFDRFCRRQTPTVLRVETAPEAQASLVVLSLDNSIASAFHVDRVTPQPETVTAGSDNTRYVFRAASTGPIQIQFHLMPFRWGGTTTRIARADGSYVVFRQWIHF